MNLSLGNDSKSPWYRPIGSLQTFKVRQTLAPQFLYNTSTTLPTFFGLSFLASSLDNFASLANVFDQYRIDMIEVLIIPDVTEVTPGSAGTSLYLSAVDYENSTAPSSLAELGGYASCIESSGNSQHYHRWEPQFAVAAYSGTFTSYAAQSGWVDCSSPNVQHYGLKIAHGATGAAFGVNAAITYHVSFRATH